MEIKDLKKIIDLIKSNDVAELELQDGDFRLSAKMKGAEPQVVVASAAAPVAPAPVPMPAAAGAPAGTAPAASDASDGPTGKVIPSPMVGTFYRASSPEADVFVKVGDTVEPDTVVCIVEAMKVMNEIKAETSGRIAKILVDNADAVEFGQPLFELEA